MDKESILKEIHDRYKDNEYITKFCNEYSHQCDINDPDVAENFVRLAYILYLLDDADSSKRLLSLFTSIEFNGYDLWTWVDFALVLLIRINRIEGKSELSEKYKSKVISVLDRGSESVQRTNKKVFLEMLAGKTLYYEDIEDAIKENDYSAEFDYRLTLFMQIIKIRELGGSEKYPVSKAEEEIELNIVRLKYLLSEVNWEEVFPFYDLY